MTSMLSDHRKTASSCAARSRPRRGYRHQVDVRVEYVLDDSGLTTTVTGTNRGHTVAPWVTSGHPYLVAGPGRVDDWTLELPASRALTVSEDRLIPEGLVSLDEGHKELGFRSPRRIGTTFIDHAFTGLSRDRDGLAAVRLTADNGEGVAMCWASSCPWVQVHTGDRPEPADHRLGLAVEPMTCAPDAFKSGDGLLHLARGESNSATWRLLAL